MQVTSVRLYRKQDVPAMLVDERIRDTHYGWRLYPLLVYPEGEDYGVDFALPEGHVWEWGPTKYEDMCLWCDGGHCEVVTTEHGHPQVISSDGGWILRRVRKVAAA